MNEGVFKGALKGLSLSLLQFSTVMFPAVYLTSKSNSDSRFTKFVTSYTLFDTIMYPLDSIKNILYADTLGSLSTYLILNRSENIGLNRKLQKAVCGLSV